VEHCQCTTGKEISASTENNHELLIFFYTAALLNWSNMASWFQCIVKGKWGVCGNCLFLQTLPIILAREKTGKFVASNMATNVNIQIKSIITMDKAIFLTLARYLIIYYFCLIFIYSIYVYVFNLAFEFRSCKTFIRSMRLQAFLYPTFL
jgi:hypothetical protein